MKGLLLKDFYQLIKNCKMFFLFDIVFLAVSFVYEGNMMFIGFPVMFSGILPLTLLAYDEREGWTDYCGTLPFSEKQIVSSKFLFGLIAQSVTAAVVAVIVSVQGLIYPERDILENFFVVGVMFIASLVFPALCLPFCYKFGTEKGRVAYLIVVAITTGVCMPLYGTIVDYFQKNEAGNLKIIFPLVLAGITVVYIISWLISIPLLKSNKK